MDTLAAVIVLSGLTSLTLFTASMRSLSSEGAALDPRWPAHARFHAATYSLTRAGASLVAASLIVAQIVSPRPLLLLTAIALLFIMDLVELGVDAIPKISARQERGVTRWSLLVHLGAVLVAGALALTLELSRSS